MTKLETELQARFGGLERKALRQESDALGKSFQILHTRHSKDNSTTSESKVDVVTFIETNQALISTRIESNRFLAF